MKNEKAQHSSSIMPSPHTRNHLKTLKQTVIISFLISAIVTLPATIKAFSFPSAIINRYSAISNNKLQSRSGRILTSPSYTSSAFTINRKASFLCTSSRTKALQSGLFHGYEFRNSGKRGRMKGRTTLQGFFSRKGDIGKEEEDESKNSNKLEANSNIEEVGALANLTVNASESLINDTLDFLFNDDSINETLDVENSEEDITESYAVPADANVVGISSSTSFFPTNDDIVEDETEVDEVPSKSSETKKKNILLRALKFKRSQRKSLKKEKSVTMKSSPKEEQVPNTEALSLENATKVELVGANNVLKTNAVVKTYENDPKPKKKKGGILPKHFTTYVSMALLFILAAPVPKRFSAFLEDDGNAAIRQKRYYYESSKPTEKKNDVNEWWKENTSSKSKDDSSTASATPKTFNDDKNTFSQEKPIEAAIPPSSNTKSTAIKSSTSFVAAAVEKIGPSVVRIDTEIYASASDDPYYFLNPFAQPDSGGEDGDPSSSDQLIRSGQGSGIIFSHHGLVLTNAHVVDGANRVYVTLTDGRKFVAEVTGADEMVDIAVLKILEHAPWGGHSPWGNGVPAPKSNQDGNKADKASAKYPKDYSTETNSWKGEPLPVANLGDSNDLQVGEFVIAVGNPGGLDNTVTMGIVSSLKRSSEEIGLPSKKVTFIQTDAAVNPGNSGGPLVNEHGQIIGINTCIRANMEGIAFAIPINKAKEIMFDLAEGKNIQHGYIGVVMMSVTPDFARQNNLDPNSPVGIIPEVHGVMIERVLGNTPAAIEGGLRRLDIVLEIGGVTVKNAGEAAKLVDSAKVGQDLEVKILRAGKEMVTSVKPADLAEKIRQKKQMVKRPPPGNGKDGGGGGRIYVLPFPTP